MDGFKEQQKLKLFKESRKKVKLRWLAMMITAIVCLRDKLVMSQSLKIDTALTI